jgi:hypothetical protein
MWGTDMSASVSGWSWTGHPGRTRNASGRPNSVPVHRRNIPHSLQNWHQAKYRAAAYGRQHILKMVSASQVVHTQEMHDGVVTECPWQQLFENDKNQPSIHIKYNLIFEYNLGMGSTDDNSSLQIMH